MPRDTYLAWDTAANKRITAYLMTHSKRLFPDAVYDPTIREIRTGPISRANERIIRAFRLAWADDMRAGPVPDDQGEAWWQDCMERAEAEIARKDSTTPSAVEAEGAAAKAAAPEPKGTDSFTF